jgi:predicted AlkP superfamily pyrophosphatase or phosphodiesterase
VEIIDKFGVSTSYIRSDLDLLKPVLDRSVAGVLPELIRGLSIDGPAGIIPDCVENKDVAKKIQESYPSGYDNIIFLICDAIGVSHLQSMGGLIWDNINTQGTVASSVFPTMTSTVMTSLSFGKLPGDHGLVGYNIYNEFLDEVWNALNLQYVKGGDQKTVTDDIEMDKLVNGIPVLDRITETLDFPVTFIAPNEYSGEPNLIDLINHNISIHTYKDPTETVEMIFNNLNQDHQNQMIAVYLPYGDYAAHLYGPESNQYIQSIRAIEMGINSILHHPKVKDGSTIVAMTSDHGQSQVDHSISKWMDRETWNKHKEQGILLSTSGRVIHAYCKNDLAGGKELLTEMASNQGLVIDTDEALRLAGGSTQFGNRFGDYLLLMENNFLYDVPEVVKFGEGPDKLHGQHGSLSEQELFVPVGIFGG